MTPHADGPAVPFVPGLAPTMASALPSHVLQDLRALEKRVGRVEKSGHRLAVTAAALAMAYLALQALANWLAPATEITGIHMPDAVVQLYNSAKSRPFNTAADLMYQLMEHMVPVSKVLAVVMLAGNGILLAMSWITNAKASRWLHPTVASLVMVLSLVFVDGMVKETSDHVWQMADPKSIAKVLDSEEYESLRQAVFKGPVPVELRDYILAQATLLHSPKSEALSSAEKAILVERVRRIDASIATGDKSPFKGSVLAVLEIQALGQAQSAPAKEYVARATANSAWARRASWLAGGLGMALILTSGLVVVATRTLRARIARIHGLLGHSATHPAPEHENHGPSP